MEKREGRGEGSLTGEVIGYLIHKKAGGGEERGRSVFYASVMIVIMSPKYLSCYLSIDI